MVCIFLSKSTIITLFSLHVKTYNVCVYLIGEPLYVARARHEGDLIPGKLVPSHNVAYVPYGGGEHGHSDYGMTSFLLEYIVFCFCCGIECNKSVFYV